MEDKAKKYIDEFMDDLMDNEESTEYEEYYVPHKQSTLELYMERVKNLILNYPILIYFIGLIDGFMVFSAIKYWIGG